MECLLAYTEDGDCTSYKMARLEIKNVGLYKCHCTLGDYNCY